MSDDYDTEFDRRTFIKNGAVGAFGFGGLVAQDEPDRARYARRMALDYPERLDGGPRRKLVLLTDRTDDDPDVSEVDACGFANWPPDRLTVWEGIIVDWKNAARDFGFGLGGGTPTVEADRLVERDRIFVDEQHTPVPLGTPYVVNGVQQCPGELLGVTATKLPGISIETGPDVGTSG